MLLASLMVVGAPVSAADDVILEWDEFDYPDAGEEGDWFRDANIAAVGPIAEAIDGTLYAYADGLDNLFKSDDVGRTWEETDYAEDLTGEGDIVDIACSSLDADILYVTDGNYVYKSDDAGDEWDYVAQADLEKYLAGACGTTITGTPIICLDVGYDADDDPYVFIGVRFTHASSPSAGNPDILYIDEEAIGAQWVGLDLDCYAPGQGYVPYSVGVTPDFATASTKLMAVISDGTETHVIDSTLGICGWSEVAELVWNCIATNHFGISAASKIGFPDDYEDTETVFVGVVSTGAEGGDVYSVTEPDAIDRNVEPGEGGCIGDHTNIIGLTVCGDTDEASILAGANDDTTVYYSTDGGWEWDPSEKNPTGVDTTLVLWVGDDCGESALAATSGCECALSLTCISDEVEDVGESWNQISLIDTDITCVKDLSHSPGYITDSETLFMVTSCEDCCPRGKDTSSLFRYDGTYWDRVFCSTSFEDDMMAASEQIEMVLVSPDFADTSAVFVANTGFDIFRSVDAGCSWDRLSYPCEEIPIASWAVLDEDTVYAGGNGVVYKTEKHGSRPWDECEITAAGWVMYFSFADDYIAVGDSKCQVFFCEFDPDEDWEDQDFDEVGEGTDGCQDILDCTNKDTSVAFDPGFAVSGDDGENTIFAAAGNIIARCVIDWDEDMEDQEWTEISDDVGNAWGIKVAGDTALYVGDMTAVNDEGGMLRSLNPLEEDEDDVVFERVTEELPTGTMVRGLRTITAGENGCPTSNVLWAIGVEDFCDEVWFYEDTLATPVILGSPSDGASLDVEKTDEVTLMWEAFCETDWYEIELYKYCAECPDNKIDVDGFPEIIECDEDIDLDCVGCSDESCCIVIEDLEPGTTYYWKVRAAEFDDDDMTEWQTLSKFSELWTFTTAMPAIPFVGLCSPECGANDIIITPNFSWEAVEDATSYEVQLATDEDFTDAVTGTPTVNAWLGAPELDYDTTYYWRVRVVKDGITSEWTTCIFTTMEEPVEVWISPYTGEKFYSEAELLAHIDAWEAAHAPKTPLYIWVIIAIGALLVIAVIVLIVRTRRVA